MKTPEAFVAFLQSSISPIVIISGVGLLLLSVTNRLGRAIDRTRKINELLKNQPEVAVAREREQLRIMFLRCRLLQTSVAFICAAIFAAGLLICLMAAMFLFGYQAVDLGVGLFMLSVVSINLAVLLFLIDVGLALKALKIDVQHGTSTGAR